MRPTTIEVRGRQGHTLRVDLDGDGPPLVYLHGLTGLGRIARGEAPRGFRVATFDQRGHGRGPALRHPHDYLIDGFVADVVAVLDALADAEPQYGWQRAVVGGSSMGSAVALRLALDHPGRVRALALAGPAFSDEENTAVADSLLPLADVVERRGLPGALPTLRAARLERGLPPETLGQLDGLAAHDAAVFPTVVRAVCRWVPFPDLTALGCLGLPAVVVAWPGDPLHPLTLAVRVAALLNAPLTLLDGVARVLAEPESVAAAFGSLRAKLLTVD